jgi:prepilin-type N-terminal cleavage/methylation domain-containing protein
VIRRAIRKGVSLIEMIVAIGVFSTVLVSLAMIMNAGYEQYWTASGSLEVQKAALIGTNLLVSDLTQSNIDSVEVVDDPSDPPFDSIIFALPDDIRGDRHYSKRGVIEWHSFICYYTEDVKGVRSLIRKMAGNPTPTIEVPVPSTQAIDFTFMQAQPAPRMMLAGVDRFDVTKREDLVRVELTGIFEQRGTFSITVRNQAFPKN